MHFTKRSIRNRMKRNRKRQQRGKGSRHV
jgi:hypothetical protein